MVGLALIVRFYAAEWANTNYYCEVKYSEALDSMRRRIVRNAQAKADWQAIGDGFGFPGDEYGGRRDAARAWKAADFDTSR